MNPSRLFIQRPVATSLLMVAILLAGFLAYKQLPLSALQPPILHQNTIHSENRKQLAPQQQLPEFQEERTMQWFCEKVSYHVLCGHVLYDDFIGFDVMRDEKVPYLDVPCFLAC